MGYVYDINHTSNDKKSRNCLFATHGMMSVITLFVSTFLVAHIYSFNGNIYDYIFNVGLFNMVSYATMAIFGFLFGYLVDKTNRIWIFRLSLVLRAAFVVVVIFFGKDLAQILWLAGILNGFSEILYYSSYNVLREEMVSRKNQGGYSTAIQVIVKIIEIVCPIALGALIEVTTYSQVAIVVFAICLAQIGVSFGIKSQRPEGSNFDLKNYFKKIKKQPESYGKMKIIYLICCIYGAPTLINILLNVCIMIQFGSSFSLGALTSIFSAVSVITLLLITKFTKISKRDWIYLTCGLLIISGGIMMFLKIDIVTVVLFNAIYALMSIVYKFTFDLHKNSILKESGLYSEISEHHSVIEVVAAISRTVGFAIMLCIGLLHSLIAFEIFLLIVCIVMSLYFVLLFVYEKKFLRNKVLSQNKSESDLNTINIEEK